MEIIETFAVPLTLLDALILDTVTARAVPDSYLNNGESLFSRQQVHPHLVEYHLTHESDWIENLDDSGKTTRILTIRLRQSTLGKTRFRATAFDEFEGGESNPVWSDVVNVYTDFLEELLNLLREEFSQDAATPETGVRPSWFPTSARGLEKWRKAKEIILATQQVYEEKADNDLISNESPIPLLEDYATALCLDGPYRKEPSVRQVRNLLKAIDNKWL